MENTIIFVILYSIYFGHVQMILMRRTHTAYEYYAIDGVFGTLIRLDGRFRNLFIIHKSNQLNCININLNAI